MRNQNRRDQSFNGQSNDQRYAQRQNFQSEEYFDESPLSGPNSRDESQDHRYSRPYQQEHSQIQQQQSRGMFGTNPFKQSVQDSLASRYNNSGGAQMSTDRNFRAKGEQLGQHTQNQKRYQNYNNQDNRTRSGNRYSQERFMNENSRRVMGYQNNHSQRQDRENNSVGYSDTFGSFFAGNSQVQAVNNQQQFHSRGNYQSDAYTRKQQSIENSKNQKQWSDQKARADQAIERRDHWIPDSKAKQCSNPKCSKDFGFFQRRHHCRACCFVFCQQCTIKTNISMIKGNPKVMHSKHDPSEKHKAAKHEKESVRICQACKADMEVRNNLQWNQYNQQRVFKYREQNQQDMNSEDNLSMFSENQSRRTQEGHNESVEGENVPAIAEDANTGGETLQRTPPKDEQVEERKDGAARDDADGVQRVQAPEDPEDDDAVEEQRRLDDYLDDQQLLIADIDQEKQQEIAARKDSKTIETGRSEGRILESVDYTEHNDKNREDNHLRWKRLKELSKLHINRIVKDEMEAANLDTASWGAHLHKFVIQAVDSVKPSSRYLKDSMDFNKFVEIQLLDHCDASKSQYVNGSVVMKNLADRRMPRHFENPSILLLKGSLGFMRSSEDGLDTLNAPRQDIYMDINSVINQEDHYVQILQEKINLISPNVIVTEKDISFKVLEVLRRNDIAAITNLHIDKMKKLARLTKTIIAPSANVIHKNFQMGKCKSFRVVDPPRPSIIGGGGIAGRGGRTSYGLGFSAKNSAARSLSRPSFSPRNGEPSLSRYNASRVANSAEIDQSKQVIFFEGCNPVLGCTILLSGPFREKMATVQHQRGAQGVGMAQDFDKKTRDVTTRANLVHEQLSGYFRLLKVQWSLRKMLHMSRNVILERELLYQLKVTPPAQSAARKGEAGESKSRLPQETPFLVTKMIKNRSTLVLYKVMIKKGLQTLKNEQTAGHRRYATNQTFEQDSFEATAGLEAGSILARGKANKKRTKNVFAQSNEPDRGRQTSPDALLPEPVEGPANEKQSRIDENFVKTKFDSMCGQPRKIKFQFYNINLVNYDLRYQQQYTAQHHAENTERQQHGDQKPQYLDFVDKLDCHHFEKDETLGSFLTRIAQQCEKNKDSVQEQIAQYQRYQEGRLGCQSHSTYFYGMSNSNYDPEIFNQAFGGKGRSGHLGPGGENGAERQCHILQCTHKACKDQLSRHVQSFYHRDGHLDIEVQPYQRRPKAMASMHAHNDSKTLREDQLMLFEEKNHNDSLQGRHLPGQGPKSPGAAHNQPPSVAYGTSAFFIPQKNQPRNRSGEGAKSFGQTAGAQREKRVRNWHKIFMSSQCNICGHSSQQQQLLSDTLFEYSVSRFIEQYFYNSSLARQCHSGCEHCPLRDATRWFHLADGSTISFKFTAQDVYTIDLLNIKQQNNNKSEVAQLCAEKKERLDYLIAVKQTQFKSLIGVFSRAAEAQSDELIMKGLDTKKKEGDSLPDAQAEKAQDIPLPESGRDADPLMVQLLQMKEIMQEQVQKLDQYFERFCGKTKDCLAQVLAEQELQPSHKHSQKHYTPQEGLKLNFIERKFVINFLTADSVARQYLKGLCIVLALIEQRELALEVGQEVAQADERLEGELARLLNRNDLTAPSLKKSLTGPRLEHPGQAQDFGARRGSLFPLLAPRQSRHLSSRVGGLSTHSLKKTISSGPQAEPTGFEGTLDEFLGLEQELIAANQAGAQASNNHANFFLMRSCPLIASHAQMLEFLQTFYGQIRPGSQGRGASEKHSEQEIKQLYGHGYRQICERIKHKIRKLFHEADLLGAAHLPATVQSPGLNKMASFATSQPEAAQEGSEENRRCGINSLFLPLGSDNGLIEVHPEDNGSIIAYALNSNLYKEALIKNNYLDFQARAKQLIQQQNELKKAPSPAAGHQGGVSRTPRQVMSLVHKDDIFNYEFAPQFIETELLCGEQQRLSFALSFSSYKEESSIQIQKHSNNNYTEIKQDENSLMFNSFKKVKFSAAKPDQAQTQPKGNRGEGTSLAQSSKLFAKYKDLNLQTQILRDYPIHLLDAPNTSASQQRSLHRDKTGQREPEQGDFAYDSIMVLQTKVYNHLFQMFFESASDNVMQQQLIQNQMQGQFQEQHNLAPQQPLQAQIPSNQKSRPQIVVGGGFGVAVATNAPQSTTQNQAPAPASNLPPPQPSQRQKSTKQSAPDAAIQSSLFGIRRPVSIFFDSDYKQRIMAEEMVAAQQIVHPSSSSYPQEPAGSQQPLAGGHKDRASKDGQGPAAHETKRSEGQEDSFQLKEELDVEARAHGKASPQEASPQTIMSPRSPWAPALAPPAAAGITKVDYNVKLYYPKKFEVLRKFYCGSHLNFIQSMMSSDSWKDVTGGKTQSPFQKTFDKKYVMKEVKRPELKMFLEFAPQYFDYLCKSFFHDYPCTLAKIVGVYKIKITKYVEKPGAPALAGKGALYTGTEAQSAGLPHSGGADGHYQPGHDSAALRDYRADQGVAAGIIDPDDQAEYLQSCSSQVLEKNQKVNIKTIKKYVFVSENLNYGLTDEDERNIIRYDLKGSTLNRFVMDPKDKEGKGHQPSQTSIPALDPQYLQASRKASVSHHNLKQADLAILGYNGSRTGSVSTHAGGSNHHLNAADLHKLALNTTKDNRASGRATLSRVYHDNNYIYEMGARPLPMRYNMNKILNVCVNNDTLCLAKSQIIDYSLLVIINTQTKKLRFGIIDYVQHYTLEKMFETRFKKFWKGNEPTIIEPEKYKKRFKKAIKRYFVAMCIQNEKIDKYERPQHLQIDTDKNLVPEEEKQEEPQLITKPYTDFQKNEEPKIQEENI